MLGLQGASLAEEADPNSDGAQTRSLGKSIARMLALNPKLTAEERLKTMKVMGVDVSDLQYYMSTQGVKQTVVPGVTRTRDIMFEDLDYDKDSYAATQRKYNSMIATRLAGADISQQEVFTSVEGLKIEDKTAMRASALEASMSMAKLELDLVNSGSSFGLIGLAARRDLLDGIYNSLDGGNDGVEEIAMLMKNISDGKALEVIMSIYNSKGSFTKDDYQNIINGVIPEGKGLIPEDIESNNNNKQEQPPVPVDLRNTIIKPKEKPISMEIKEDEVEVETLGTEEKKMRDQVAYTNESEDVAALRIKIANARSPEIREMFKNELTQLQEIEAEEDKQEAYDTKFPDAESRAADTLDKKESMRKAMADYTKDEWKSMSRSQREEAGLPVTGFDLGLAGGSAFKIEVDAAEANAFLEENQKDILNYLLNKGFTGKEADKEYELAIAGWFDEQRKSGNRVKKIGSLNKLAISFKGAMELIKADKNNKE